LAIFAIFIIPYFIAKIDFSKKEEMPVIVEEPVPPTPLENDKNIIRIENIAPAYVDPEIIATISMGENDLAITKNQVETLPDGETFPFPEGLKNPNWALEMDDLGLIFIISQDGKTFSFSPISKKFQEGKLNLPSESKIAAIKSYLTYLYALDPKNNQIYRYFRSDAGQGGFGEKSNWIKDSTDISNAADMAVSDNIYLTDGDNLLKFFQGKKIDFKAEASATPIVFNQDFTKSEMENIYVLDKTNSRIVKFSLDGNILAQYHHEAIRNAKGFSINEEKNLVYFFDAEGVKSFEMR
jgi:hypothetical protein